MSRNSKRPAAKRRTTVTLPASALRDAVRIARSRNVTLSAVVAEGLNHVIQTDSRAQEADEIIEGYRKAFEGLSEEEMMILDGIILQPMKRRK
jgi:hypothetical protein